MNESRLMKQVTAIFSVFMCIFYMGVGIFFIWFADILTVDKSMKIILGITFLFYGLYRAFRAFENIKQTYFSKNENRNDDYPDDNRFTFFKKK